MVTVFVNKLLLNSETFNLDAPLFVTWSQCVVSTAICYFMGRLSKWKPNLVSFPTGNPLDMRTIRNVSCTRPQLAAAALPVDHHPRVHIEFCFLIRKVFPLMNSADNRLSAEQSAHQLPLYLIECESHTSLQATRKNHLQTLLLLE